MIYFIEESSNIIEDILLKYGNFSTRMYRPISHYPHIKVIDMSLEEHREKELKCIVGIGL